MNHTVRSQLYELCGSGREQKAIEVVLIYLERSLRRADWRLVDDILEQLDVTRLTPAILIAALSITVPARAFLSARPAFLRRAEAFMAHSLGHEKANALLATRR